MTSYIQKKWRCSDCGECHTYEDHARICCLPSVREVYMCPECGDDHDEESEAIACCHDPDAEPQPLSSAELEAMGQQRLCGV